MSDEELVARAEELVAAALSAGGAVSATDLETAVKSQDAELDGQIIGIAVLRLLRRGEIDLTSGYDFVAVPLARVAHAS